MYNELFIQKKLQYFKKVPYASNKQNYKQISALQSPRRSRTRNRLEWICVQQNLKTNWHCKICFSAPCPLLHGNARLVFQISECLRSDELWEAETHPTPSPVGTTLAKLSNIKTKYSTLSIQTWPLQHRSQLWLHCNTIGPKVCTIPDLKQN